MNEADRSLEEIRLTELEAARTVEEARAKAAQILDEAEARSRELIEEGRRRGRDRAMRSFEESKEEIRAEADKVRGQGIADAESLVRAGDRRVDELVDELIAVVLAPPRERGK